MNKEDLIRKVARKCNHTIKETRVSVDALFDIIADEVINDENVFIFGFGKFEKYYIQPRKYTNFSSGEEKMSEGYYGFRFRPANILKKAVRENA